MSQMNGPRSIWRYFRWGVLVIITLLIGSGSWLAGQNYFGYCRAEGRYLSDQEKIDIAVTHALSVYPPSIAIYGVVDGKRRSVDIRPPRKPIYYSSKEDFLRENRNCCALTDSVREGQHVTTIDRLTGRLSTFVTVSYLVKYIDETGRLVEEPSSTFSALSNCGYESDRY